MSRSLRRAVALLTSAIVFLAGAFPNDGLAALTALYRIAVAHPVRATCIAVAGALIVYAFWDDVLDAVGFQTTRRLGNKIKDWAHLKMGCPLLKTDISKNSFSLIIEYEKQRYLVEKQSGDPFMIIGCSIRYNDEAYIKAADEQRNALRQEILLELARIGVDSVRVLDQDDSDGHLKVQVQNIVVVDRDFNEFGFSVALHRTMRSMFLARVLWERWKLAIPKAGLKPL